MTHYLLLQNQQLVISHTAQSPLLPEQSVDELKPFFIRDYDIGKFNQSPVYAAKLAPTATLPDGFDCIPFKSLLAVYSVVPDWYSIVAKAYSIIQWDKNHAFCGRCGRATALRKGVFERTCNDCALTFYPRISPSIIVRIRKGDELLMARSHHFNPGIYALIAGFVEPGETLEEAVHREVKEEVGITISNVQYFGSQSWPFPDSLMIGFTADYASGDIRMNPNEIEDAGWYRYDKLPGRPTFRISIATRLIEDFIYQQRSCESRPIDRND